MKYYQITDAAKKVDVESHVLRYWEDELELPIERNKQGHRLYTEEDLSRFLYIKELKKEGLQLRAIRTKVHLRDSQRAAERAGGAAIAGTARVDAAAGTARGDAAAGTARVDEAAGTARGDAAAGTARGDAAAGTARGDAAAGTTRGNTAAGAQAERTAQPGETLRITDAASRAETASAEGENGEVLSENADSTQTAHAADKGRREEAARSAASNARREEAARSTANNGRREEPARSTANNGRKEEPAKNAAPQKHLPGKRNAAAALAAEEDKTRKAARLCMMLQQMVSAAVREENQELMREIKKGVAETVSKEMNYQFSLQEQREEEHYKKLDEILRERERSNRLTHMAKRRMKKEKERMEKENIRKERERLRKEKESGRKEKAEHDRTAEKQVKA